MAPKTDRKKIRQAIAKAFTVEANDKRVLQAADEIIEIIEQPEQPGPAAPKGNAFKTYADNIALLTPFSSQELGELVDKYTDQWVVDAIGIAVKQNARNLKFISGVLRKWDENGKGWEPERKQGAAQKKDYYTDAMATLKKIAASDPAYTGAD